MNISIIILNWNGWRDTLECLESLQRLKKKNFNIVIVDNASSDGSGEIIKAWLSKSNFFTSKVYLDELNFKDESGGFINLCATYIQSNVNGGFANGNNKGIVYALNHQADAIWLLNNDTTVDEHSLIEIESKVSLDSKIGMCGSTLLYYHDKEIIQAVGGVEFDFVRARGRQLGQGLSFNNVNLELIKSFKPTYISGASLLVTKDFLNDVGLMEESYFLYFEEIDWAVRSAGRWNLATAYESIIYHKEGGSIGTSSLTRRSKISQYYLMRNLIRFYCLRKKLLFPVALFSVVKEILSQLRKRDVELCKITVMALFDALRFRSGKKVF